MQSVLNQSWRVFHDQLFGFFAFLFLHYTRLKVDRLEKDGGIFFSIGSCKIGQKKFPLFGSHRTLSTTEIGGEDRTYG